MLSLSSEKVIEESIVEMEVILRMEYLSSTKISRGVKTVRRPTNERKLYYRQLQKVRTKTVTKEKEPHEYETYSSIEQVKAVVKKELERLKEIEEERQYERWYAWDHETRDWLY